MMYLGINDYLIFKIILETFAVRLDEITAKMSLSIFENKIMKTDQNSNFLPTHKMIKITVH